MAKKFYVSDSGTSKLPKKWYVSVLSNEQWLSKEVKTAYCSDSDLSKLFWDGGYFYNRFVICQPDAAINYSNCSFDNYIVIDTGNYNYLNIDRYTNSYQTIENSQLQYDDNGIWTDIDTIDVSTTQQTFDVSSYGLVRLYFTVRPPVGRYGAVSPYNITLSDGNDNVGIYTLRKIVMCHANSYFSVDVHFDNQIQIDSSGYNYLKIGSFKNDYNQLTRAKLQYERNDNWYDIADVNLSTTMQTFNVANYSLVRLFITVYPPVQANGEISLENVSLSN